MPRHCTKVEVLDDCGHTSLLEYMNCGNHIDDDANNSACHSETADGRGGYVQVRKGLSKCLFPCTVASMGWLLRVQLLEGVGVGGRDLEHARAPRHI
jgi:hypothetical protein